MLLQAQDFAGFRLVVRIQDFADGLGRYLLADGVVVIAFVEGLKVEGVDCLGGPETQEVGHLRAEAGDGNIVGDAAHDVLGNPAHAEVAMIVVILLGVSAVADVVRDFRARHLPRIAEAQPLVGLFNLPAVLYFLIEEAELVANAVADGRNIQRGERIHVAGGEAA